MSRIFCLILTLALAFPVAAHAADPMETLKATVDEVLVVLQDPRYADPALHDEQRRRIWDLTRGSFDFDLIAKRAAGRYHWRNSFTPDEQRRFTELFSEFLAGVYMGRLKGQFAQLTVEYLGQEIAPSGRQAKVQTRVRQKNLATPIEYSMIQRDGAWKVFDIFVEGISLAQNYQAQFRSLLERQTAAQVIAKLEEKIADQKATPGGG